jgi:hypothetical protein
MKIWGILMLYDELRQVGKGVVANYATSPEQHCEISRLSDEVSDTERMRIFDRYASESSAIASVLEGGTTFLELGKPIIDRSREIEKYYAGRKFGRVNKSDILGNDARNERDVKETVQYLKEGRIIDPSEYFCNKWILPGPVNKVGMRVSKAVDVAESRPGLFLSFATGLPILAGVACGVYQPFHIADDTMLNFAWNFVSGSFGACFGVVYPVLSCQYSFGSRNKSIERRRESFQNALEEMDSIVNRLYSKRNKVLPFSSEGA